MTSSADRAAPNASAVLDGAPAPKLLDRLRDHLCTRHYSIRTETACVDWVRRFIRVSRQGASARDGRSGGGGFFTHLALQRNVSASTQNQARAAVGHADVSTTMIYSHVLNKGGRGVPSPLDAR